MIHLKTLSIFSISFNRQDDFVTPPECSMNILINRAMIVVDVETNNNFF